MRTHAVINALALSLTLIACSYGVTVKLAQPSVCTEASLAKFRPFMGWDAAGAYFLLAAECNHQVMQTAH